MQNICKNCKKDFLIEDDDFSFYEKNNLPPPTFCSLCRVKRRLFFRNFRTLYKRNSDKSGKSIISMYHKDQPFPVWERDEWYALDWDAVEYGRDFDFTKTFFEQYKALSLVVPRFALMINNSENCTYSNLCNRSSNCYFVFGCVDNEYCDYGHSIWNCREIVDSLYMFKSEFCYECIDVTESSQLLYCEECVSCTDSIGLFNCRNCLNCIGCVGLRNKSYCIFNQQVSKEEYKQFLLDHPIKEKENIKFILKNRDELKKVTPTPHMFGTHNTNVEGNHIFQGKNIKESFDVKGGEDSKYGFTIRKMVDSYDCNFSLDVENCYEIVFSHPFNLKFCHLAVDCTDSMYSEFCFNSNNVFGCIGLRKKDYCILNKQYTKEEYEVLLPKIIEHMKKTGEYGEFFPISLSPFTYNESTVGEYYPLEKEEAIKQGYSWRDDIPFTTGQENLKIQDITEDQVYDFIFLKDKVFCCDACKRNYRFTEHELSFYKRFYLGLPKQCFFCRHARRMKERPERILDTRSCMCENSNHSNHTNKCDIEIKTVYTKDRPEVVYCEKCYQQEMY